MRTLITAAGLLLTTSAMAGADGDGFTVLDGDCNDYDALTYPGAPEVCDGIDNNCDEIQVISTFIMNLGNGDWGESITFKTQDRQLGRRSSSLST